MWVATPNHGVMCVNLYTEQVNYIKNNPKLSASISDNRIQRVSKDKDNNIIATTDN